MMIKGVLQRIVPSSEERIQVGKAVDELHTKTREAIDKLEVDAKPMVVGSVAKDTWLSDPDIDIFLLFHTSISEKALESAGLEIGKHVLNGRTRYAQHPYVNGRYRGFDVDIVPCYRVKRATAKLSAVDRTPFHTRYVQEKLSERQKNEVRLLKQFAHGIGVYGAEAEVEGFSGYLCELLILEYGDFNSVIGKAKSWKKGEVIGKSSKRFEAPLVVIDPVDSSRNVASALSLDNFCLFLHACNEYSKKPSEQFFFPQPLRTQSKPSLHRIMRERGTTFFGIQVEKPDLIPDTLYPQIRKCKRSIEKLLIEYNPIRSSFYVDDHILFIFELERGKLPTLRIHQGPQVWRRKSSQRFLSKWNKFTPYIAHGRWCVDIYIKENIESLLREKIADLSVGKDLKKELARGYEVVGYKVLVAKYQRELTQFLQRKFRWEW